MVILLIVIHRPTESAINKELQIKQLLPPGNSILHAMPDIVIGSQIRQKQNQLDSKQSQVNSLLARLNATTKPQSKATIKAELGRLKTKIERLQADIKELRNRKSVRDV